MTETTTEYITKLELGFKPAKCPSCGIVFGHEVQGGKYLKLGSLKITKLSAECDMPLCGEPIWWTSSERHLKKITTRKKEREPTTSPPK